ncbi:MULTISPECIES: ribonuclease P protein component [Arthrobacter]|uniref:ribonuclease P protein component n=1 Tax=Arthrobacter TaxID=1663 RepID=UPI0009E8CEBA|nr:MULTISPECIES: ribonuclease P protein component [Arthrobacter]
MLATKNRMRTSANFSNTVRSGVRNGRRNVVLYMVSTSDAEPSQIGFIVAKTVGNAVTRNLVKRRLREIVVETIKAYPQGVNVVVRALPVSAQASFSDLVMDYRKAFSTASTRLREKAAGSSPLISTPTVDKAP